MTGLFPYVILKKNGEDRKMTKPNDWVYTDKRYTKKCKEYTNRITYESFWDHTHPFWEMFFIVKGSVTHYLNGVPKRLNAGDAVMIRPGDRHYFKNTTLEYEHRDLYLNTLTFKSLCDTFSPNLYPFFCGYEGLIFVQVEQIHQVSLLKTLDELFMEQETHDNEKIATLHIPISTNLLGFFSQKYFAKQDESTKEFNNFLIKMNTEKYICGSLEEIVEMSNYSHSYLCKLFKERTGKTLKYYHSELKMNYAIELLKNFRFSILQISSKLGYNSLSHFIKVFKSHTAMTPTTYRKSFFNR